MASSQLLDSLIEAGLSSASAVEIGARMDYMGYARSRRLGNMLTKGFQGRLNTQATGGNPHTTHIQFALESHYDAVRIIIPNSVTSAITGVTARVSAGGAAGAAGSSTAIAPSDGAWPNVTWAGASSVTLPAGVSIDDASWTVSDWVTVNSLDRTDGGTLPLLHVRVYIPGANANRPSWAASGLTAWETEATVAGRIVRPRTQAVDGVTTLGNFTTGGSVSNYQCVPVYVQYASRVDGITVMVVGDSIDEGAGATSQRGANFLAQAAVSTMSAPVEFCVAAIGGSNSTAWRARLEALIDKVKPDYVLFPGFEVNDTATPMTTANIKMMRGNIERARSIVASNGAVPIIRTGIPANATGTFAKAWGSSDSMRQMLNAERRGTVKYLLADYDNALAGAVNGSGQIEFGAGYTTDALHPNDAGHERISTAVLSPLLRQLQAVNGLI